MGWVLPASPAQTVWLLLNRDPRLEPPLLPIGIKIDALQLRHPLVVDVARQRMKSSQACCIRFQRAGSAATSSKRPSCCSPSKTYRCAIAAFDTINWCSS